MNGKISNLGQIASIRRYTITEGRGKGLDVIDCDNGKLRFTLNASRALDVMQLCHEGQNVSFISKNGFTGKDWEFPRRFEGGMLYTCGLDSIGNREGYPLHGSLHCAPAEVVRAECNEDGIVVEAIIRQSALFCESLCIRRKITAAIGADTLTLEDELVNEAYREENYSILYHVNIGYPMLDEGARIVGNVTEMKPCNDWARENMPSALSISDSVDNQPETCYIMKLASPEISLVNDKLGKTFTLSYSGDTLPSFIEWKSMGSGDYALGFEPASTELGAGFEYKKIKPNEKINFKLNLKVSKN